MKVKLVHLRQSNFCQIGCIALLIIMWSSTTSGYPASDKNLKKEYSIRLIQVCTQNWGWIIRN